MLLHYKPEFAEICPPIYQDVFVQCVFFFVLFFCISGFSFFYSAKVCPLWFHFVIVFGWGMLSSYWRGGVVLIGFLFRLPGNNIPYTILFLEYSFIECGILSWQLFSLNTLRKFLHCILFLSCSYKMKCQSSLFYSGFLFSLAALRSLSVSLSVSRRFLSILLFHYDVSRRKFLLTDVAGDSLNFLDLRNTGSFTFSFFFF